MAKKKEKPVAKATPAVELPQSGRIVLRVRSKSARGFRRAGRQFGPAQTSLPLDELEPEQLALLKAEPNLVVTEVTE